jgi:G3E family GTPase
MNKIKQHADHVHFDDVKTKKKRKSNESKTKLPATVLCGFLGSGKTTLLNYILNSEHGYKIAIIVNDMSEVNIDAANVKNNAVTFKRTDEKLVELSNGCICCTLRSDLVKEVSKLAKNGKFDYLLIESTGMAEPLPIAQAFSFQDDNGRTLYDIAKIDTMATVVDACNFYDQLNSIETYQEAKIESSKSQSSELGEIPIAQLFIDQIEFCNLIIINKVDLVSEDELKSVENTVKKLNPTAEIIHSTYSKIDISKVLNTKKFDFEEAQNTEKWIEELAKEVPSSELEEYGVSSFAYKSRKPFNPEKLNNLLKSYTWKNVIRAKGYVWLASNSGYYICGSLNIVGKILTLEPMTIWWAAIRKSKWGETKDEINLVEDSVKPYWDPIYGDRRNELIFIGQKIDKKSITDALNECLISDEEFKLGDLKWGELFKDAYPEWEKVLKTHPMKKNFKEKDGEWEDDDEDIE